MSTRNPRIFATVSFKLTHYLDGMLKCSSLCPPTYPPPLMIRKRRIRTNNGASKHAHHHLSKPSSERQKKKSANVLDGKSSQSGGLSSFVLQPLTYYLSGWCFDMHITDEIQWSSSYADLMAVAEAAAVQPWCQRYSGRREENGCSFNGMRYQYL